MKVSRLPRLLVFFLSIAITATFFWGIVHSFIPARAVSDPTLTAATSLPASPEPPAASITPSRSTTPSPVARVTETPQPEPPEEFTPTPTATPVIQYADTESVTALAILLVMVVLVGVVVGERNLRKKHPGK
jgi:hypothetical protein